MLLDVPVVHLNLWASSRTGWVHCTRCLDAVGLSAHHTSACRHGLLERRGPPWGAAASDLWGQTGRAEDGGWDPCEPDGRPAVSQTGAGLDWMTPATKCASI